MNQDKEEPGAAGAALFEPETWAQLPTFFEKLPQPVHIVAWGEPTASPEEKIAAYLCQTIAGRFDTVSFEMLPRRINYDYYPVLGFMSGTPAEWLDFGVRIIGLPSGYQMTSFVTAVQAVSFRGMTLAAVSRIKLSKLATDVQIEVITAADNEGGPIMAQTAFSLAAASPHIRAYLIMANIFPQVVTRYSINYLPYTVINGRVHIEGVVDEAALLKHIGMAV